MQAQIQIAVTFVDGSTGVAALAPVDLVRFEDLTNRKVTDFGSGIGYSDICRLAWLSFQRRDASTPDFMEWMETVADINPGESEEIVPLEKTPLPSK